MHTLLRKGMSKIFDFFLDCIQSKYTVVKTLKEGPRGTVCLLRHNDTGRRFVFRTFSGDSNVYRQLLNIECPNLPGIFEVADQDGKTAVLEEYVQGDNLAWLLKESLCAPNEARKIVYQLCQAAWVLHSMGAIHRDIKPDNVILRGDEAVLIDFDASRIHKSRMVSDTQVLGTTGFAAPEQYGIAQTDPRTDIYALGVLLNVMLTGEHPSRRMAKGRLGRVVKKCTMTNPDQRYQSVLHLMEAL